MRIGIEAQRIFRADKHGMDFVVLEVLHRLQQEDDGNEYLVFVAPGPDRCLQSGRNMQVVELKCPVYPLWEQWVLPRAVRRMHIDILHCTSNTAPLYSPAPLLLTLHDIIFLNTPKSKKMSRYQQLGWYYRRWNVPRIVARCRHIITVSETEQANILAYFPQLKGKLSVVHNGYSDCYRPLTDEETKPVTRKYLADEEYLLFLGNTDPRKNTEGVLRAYHAYLQRSKRALKLVITGLKREYVEELLGKMGIAYCTPDIVYTGYVPGEDLPALYNGAFAFLYPSLQEGFGIPVLESMACGTPVITSNCSSLPEVAGEGGVLVNPSDFNEIAEALLRLENDTEYYQAQSAYGLARVKRFSWQQTTEDYRKIYNEITTRLSRTEQSRIKS